MAYLYEIAVLIARWNENNRQCYKKNALNNILSRRKF